MAEISLTKRRWGWMAFDWATQPFYTLGLTFIFGPFFAVVSLEYFQTLYEDLDEAKAASQALWFWGQTIAGLMIAFTAPIIGAYARACRLMGGPGAGQLTKMVNQICIAGLVQGLSEGVMFAQKAGLDGAAVFDVIGKGAAGSWQMDNRHTTMLADEFDFGFAVDWMRKDLGICLDEAKKNGAKLPVTALVDQFYSEIQSMGGGRWDTSSLLRRMTR